MHAAGVLVHAAVAVVVQAVGHVLGEGNLLADAASPAPVGAGLGAAVADADAQSLGGAGVAGSVQDSAVGPLVGQAIAVVVVSVAGLGSGREPVPEALAPHPDAALLRPVSAEAHAAGLGAAVVAPPAQRIPGEVFVGGTVAVVVVPVARLTDGELVARACAPLTSGAGLRAVVALPHPAVVGGAVEAGLRQRAAVARLVGRAVAVVVVPVAALHARSLLTRARVPRAQHTRLSAIAALPHPALLDQTAPAGLHQRALQLVLVGAAVAVVVVPVAALLDGELIAAARAPLAGHAGCAAVVALPHSAGAIAAAVAGLAQGEVVVPLVCQAVAVVVVAVADLVSRTLVVDARPPPTRHAALAPVRALAHAAGVCLAAVAGLGQGQPQLVLIHHAVAVVVVAVAGLGRRQLLVHARAPLAQRAAGLLAAVAEPDVLGPSGAVVAAAHQGRAELVFVGRPVAVVIGVVAELGDGELLSHARPPAPAEGTGLLSCVTEPLPLGVLLAVVAAAGQRITELVLVGEPVAVVVQPVTDLLHRELLVGALAPSSAGATALHAVVALTLAASVVSAGVADLLQRAALVSFVDLTVTVVVHAVAAFGTAEVVVAAWMGRTDAPLLRRVALPEARDAGAVGDGRARLAELEVFIDDRVAVVVEPIAELDVGGHVGAAGVDRTTHWAGQHAQLVTDHDARGVGALPLASTACAQRGPGLVDAGVAVVVQGVADLLHCTVDRVALQAARPVTPPAARAALAREAAGFIESELLVHQPVAVVVHDVAGHLDGLVARQVRVVGLDPAVDTLARLSLPSADASMQQRLRGTKVGILCVDDPVAVVVEAVAAPLGPFVGVDLSVVRLEQLTRVAAALGLPSTHTPGQVRGGQHQLLVHSPVAVVVFAVAVLGDGRAGRSAGVGGATAPARGTVALPHALPAGAVGHTWAPQAQSEVLVDGAVAVVVHPVTQLGPRGLTAALGVGRAAHAVGAGSAD